MPKIQNVGRKIGDKNIARRIQFPKNFNENGSPHHSETEKVPETLELLPGKHAVVTDAQFKHLKDNFGEEIVNLDDIKELQTVLGGQGIPPVQRPAGYLSPAEVEAEKKKAVAEALAADRATRGEMEKDNESKAPQIGQDTSLAQRIDAMDRADLVALIERENLEIVHKSVPGDKLKAMIYTALENRDETKAA